MKDLWISIMLGLMLTSVPASADVTYTIILTDDQAAALHAQTDASNKIRRQFFTSRTATKAPVDLTDTQLLETTIRNLINDWEENQHQASVQRPWPERSAREKRLHCRKQQIIPCPG